MYSITRRLVAIVLLSQLLLTGTLTAVTLLYERAQLYRTFDVMLEGRAETVAGVVQDAEDTGDNVFLDTEALNVPKQDLYEVRDEAGRLLGRSPNWPGRDEDLWAARDQTVKLTVDHRDFRGLVRHGSRLIDPREVNGHITRRFVVFYASSTEPVWQQLLRVGRFLAVANSVILLATGILAVVLLRRGMAPLNELAAKAAQVSVRSFDFSAPERAKRVEELSTLATALERVLAGLRRSFEQQQTFLNDAAHELKTAVTIVKSSLQLLTVRERSAHEYRRGIETSIEDCGRMEDVVQKMLVLARSEQGVSRETASAVSVSEILADVAARLRATAEIQGIEVGLSIAPELYARIVREDCEILFSNLILNAVQHSIAGARVKITASSADGAVVCDIKDEGEGIAPEHLPHVFERFYRSDRSRSRATGGSGLGLAIARAIVEGSGGRIAIESEPGRGTRVRVELPAAAASMPEQLEREASRFEKRQLT
jgi:signal transduction histidine kinase